jgi:hypothetical protein
MKSKDFGLSLQFNANYWGRLRETPIWLGIKSIDSGGRWIYSASARQKLASLERQSPSRLMMEENTILVPLSLPLQAEKEHVIAALYDQVLEIIELL